MDTGGNRFFRFIGSVLRVLFVGRSGGGSDRYEYGAKHHRPLR